MTEKVTYLTKITENNLVTYYFYHKPTKFVLPIQILQNQSLKVFDSALGLSDTNDILHRVIVGLGAKIEGVKIYLYQNETFYTYLVIKNSKKTVEINTKFEDSIEMAIKFSIQVLVEDKVLQDCGFEVTKDMVSQALLG